MSDNHEDVSTFANHCASANILTLESFAMTAMAELVRRLRIHERNSDEHNDQLRKDRLPVTREWWWSRFGQSSVRLCSLATPVVRLHHNTVRVCFLVEFDDEHTYRKELESPTRQDIETLVRLFGGE